MTRLDRAREMLKMAAWHDLRPWTVHAILVWSGQECIALTDEECQILSAESVHPLDAVKTAFRGRYDVPARRLTL